MKRRRLGQHTLVDREILLSMVDASGITWEDKVLEIGSGLGNLTELLCARAGEVVAYEIDSRLLELSEVRLSRLSNLKLIRGDGFASNYRFDVLVSNLPYSQSRRFLEWIVGKEFRKAIVTVQKEYAEKILSPPSSSSYGVPSVLGRRRFDIEVMGIVSPEAFRPVPKISSTILSITPKAQIPPVDKVVIKWLKILFSFKGRRFRTAMKSIGKNYPSTNLDPVHSKLLDLRVEQLSPDDAFSAASTLARHNS